MEEELLKLEESYIDRLESYEKLKKTKYLNLSKSDLEILNSVEIIYRNFLSEIYTLKKLYNLVKSLKNESKD